MNGMRYGMMVVWKRVLKVFVRQIAGIVWWQWTFMMNNHGSGSKAQRRGKFKSYVGLYGKYVAAAWLFGTALALYYGWSGAPLWNDASLWDKITLVAFPLIAWLLPLGWFTLWTIKDYRKG